MTPQNYQLTEAYITALTGSPDTVMDWRVINDREKGEQAHNLRGSLSDLYQQLVQYNEALWGIFVCINELDGVGHTLHNVKAIRTHVVDLDDTFTSEDSYQRAISSNFPPHIAVQSSPSKYHLYWFVEPYSGNDFYTLQQRKIAQFYNGDKSIIDATRVLRVPGFNHCKGEPTPVTCWQISQNHRYNFSQVEQAFSQVNVIEHVGVRKQLGDDDLKAPSIEWAIKALEMKDPNDLTRDEWMSTTAAFKQSCWSYADEQTILNAWLSWCSRYQHNDDQENMKLWNSIRDTEVGWSHFERTTNVKAFMMLGEDKQILPPPASPTSVNEPVQQQDTDNLGEVLDAYGKQIWFKDCYFIERTGEIFSPSGRFMNSTKFNGKYGGKYFTLRISGGKTTDEAWKAALRSTDWTIPKVDHIRFLPTEKTFAIIEDRMGRKGLNTYIPVKIDAKQGDVSLWLEHVAKIIPDVNDRKIWLDYMAHCVKYPGHKIRWSPMLQGVEGLGKTVFFEIMRHALGDMYVYRPKAPELVASGSKFNAWMRGKLAIIVDEIKIDERRELIEILKPMITDSEIEVQAKGVDQEMEDNVANWIFFSNYKDAIPINQNGRRYSIFYSCLQTKRDLAMAGMDKAYFDRLWTWLRDQGGLQAVTYWLMNYDIEAGDVPVNAPETSSYAEALKIGRSPLEVLIDDKIESGERGFRNGYISWPLLLKAIAAVKMRRPADYNIKSILESRGYTELGHYPRILPHEDTARPPLLFGIDPMIDINQYERFQDV